MVRYLILLKLHNDKRKLINKIKEKISDKTDKFEKKFSIILKLVSLQYSYIIFPFIWGSLFLILMFSIYAINGFKCSTITAVSIRYGQLFFLFILSSVIGLAIGIDFIFNIKHLIRCRWKKYFFLDDPFHYRLDILCIILIVPFLPIWAFAPIPYLFKGIVVDCISFIVIWGNGIQALIITIIKQIYAQSTKFRSSQMIFLTMDEILSNDILLKLFIEFCESEWSSENIFFKLDVLEYKKTKTDRKTHCEIIKERYLLFSSSPFELNVRESFVNEAVRRINSELFYDELFDNLETSIDLNLLDTLQRFRFSKLHEIYQQDLKNKEESLGL